MTGKRRFMCGLPSEFPGSRGSGGSRTQGVHWRTQGSPADPSVHWRTLWYTGGPRGSAVYYSTFRDYVNMSRGTLRRGWQRESAERGQFWGYLLLTKDGKRL